MDVLKLVKQVVQRTDFPCCDYSSPVAPWALARATTSAASARKASEYAPLVVMPSMEGSSLDVHSHG